MHNILPITPNQDVQLMFYTKHQNGRGGDGFQWHYVSLTVAWLLLPDWLVWVFQNSCGIVGTICRGSTARCEKIQRKQNNLIRWAAILQAEKALLMKKGQGAWSDWFELTLRLQYLKRRPFQNSVSERSRLKPFSALWCWTWTLDKCMKRTSTGVPNKVNG